MVKYAYRTSREGFTLLEILLVVAAIGILAGIVIVAINPGQQLADTRNAQRRVDVRTIATALNQYRLKTGSLPGTLNGSADPGDCEDDGNEICRTDASSCSGMTDLSVLTDNAAYIPSIPIDPSGSDDYPDDGTGYYAAQDSQGIRVYACAPNAEDTVDDIIAIQ